MQMKKIAVGLKNSLVWRAAVLLILLVAISISVMAGVGYWKLFQVTEENASIRIDRAARAATSILAHAENSQFEVLRDADGRPTAIRMTSGTPDKTLASSPAYDAVLREIGTVNQGAANLFCWNSETQAFDRFATTFRRPDGSMPPPMSITAGHPAYASLAANSRHVGEVPVMGRQRLAYLMPIQAPSGAVAGALAVDVGWVDDLIVARERLQDVILTASGSLLLLIGALGLVIIRLEMKPLRIMASFANDVASGKRVGKVPFVSREDEVGTLAQGLARVVDLQEELAYLAYTDPLTKCGNRARYFTDLAQTIAAVKSDSERAALIHINISQFSNINAAYGQKVGDQVLSQVALEARLVFGEDAGVYRITADNFCVIVRDVTSPDAVEHMCLDVVERLGRPMDLALCNWQLDARMGVVLLPEDANDTEIAHGNAELALRSAKIDEATKVAFFSSNLNDDAQRYIHLESMLRQALDGGQLELYYQPQVCTHTRDVFGLEALLRWNHPIEGYIGPNEFIPVAEKCGLIVELGNWVLDEACRQAKHWLDDGFIFRHVSINVSPIQLWQPDFAQIVEASLKTHDVDGKYICLEVTENVFVKDDESRISGILEHLRTLGVRFSLDDFGSGYSSLGYLNRLPFDQIKIDRNFVADAHKSEDSANLLSGMIALGKGLGMSIVAEGAEKAEEVALLREIGCDAIQGFFFSRPVPAKDLGTALEIIAKDEEIAAAPERQRVSA